MLSSSVGPNCRAVISPSATPLSPDSCSTSQSWPMRCIHVPVLLSRFAEAYSRKLRTRSERNMPVPPRVPG